MEEKFAAGEIIQTDKKHVWHPWVQNKIFKDHDPNLFVEGRGARVWDANCKEYIDAMAGLWCVNAGYGRESIAKAAYEQLLKLPYFPQTHATVPAARMAEKISSLLHEGMKRVYFVNSGSEANEAAFKIARQWGRQAGGGTRYKIVGRYFSYHGTTLATLSAGGMADRKAKFEPLTPGFYHAAAPYCYRCPFGKAYPGCNLECARHIEYIINAEGPETVAGVLIEPIMSGLGVVIPPDEYLPTVEGICRKHGVLLLIDEVINGFGRTGKWFAHQHYGVKPDIVAMAKGISSAYVPLAATAATESLFESFLGEPEEMKHIVQVNTYGGHPVACAAGLENVRIMEEENLPGRAAEVGAHLVEGLKSLKTKYPMVGDVRGKGLLIGVELIKNKEKDPLPGSVVADIMTKVMANGVIISRSAHTDRTLGNTLTICPPLVLTTEEADAVVAAIDKVLGEMA